jgi:hypothetical protein
MGQKRYIRKCGERQKGLVVVVVVVAAVMGGRTSVVSEAFVRSADQQEGEAPSGCRPSSPPVRRLPAFRARRSVAGTWTRRVTDGTRTDEDGRLAPFQRETGRDDWPRRHGFSLPFLDIETDMGM